MRYHFVFRSLLQSQTVLAALLVLCGCGLLEGCTPNSVQHGNFVAQEKLDQLQPGISTQQEVIDLLGPPSSKALFDPSTWYYVGMTGEQLAFFKTQVEQESIVKLTFDKQGKLVKVKTFAPEDKEEIDPSERITPSSGHDMTILEQVFGNFGRRYQQEKS